MATLMRRSPTSRRYAYDYPDYNSSRRAYDYPHGYRRSRYVDDDDYYPRGRRHYSGFYNDVGGRRDPYYRDHRDYRDYRDDYERYRTRYYHPRTYVADWPSYKHETYSSPTRSRWYYDDAPRYEPAADGMWYDGVWCERDADGVYRAAPRDYDDYARYPSTRRTWTADRPRSAPSLSVSTPADAVPPSPAKSEVEEKVDSLKAEIDTLKSTMNDLSVALSPKKEKPKADADEE